VNLGIGVRHGLDKGLIDCNIANGFANPEQVLTEIWSSMLFNSVPTARGISDHIFSTNILHLTAQKFC